MSRKRLTMEDLKEASATVQKRNPGLFGAIEPQNVQTRDVECKSRLDKLNKTEARWLDEHGALRNGLIQHVIVQPTRFFELRGGGSYTPDFLVFQTNGFARVIEIKGGYRGPGWEHGIERFKRAAAQYHFYHLRFELWTWSRKDGQWDVERWKD
jgi:hypothetical protein